MGIFELPDKNAAAHRVVNNGKIFSALGYQTVFLGAVKGEHFIGIRKSSYDENVYEEAYPIGVKDWSLHMMDTKNIEAVIEKYPDTLLVIVYNVPLVTYNAIKKCFSKKGIKVAYDCTEWNDYTVGSLLKRLYKKRDAQLVQTKLHKCCDDIIVISSIMEEQYQGKNILKLPPLVDVEDQIWHQKRISHNGVFEFCFAGTVVNKERVDSIIKAFLTLNRQDVRLRIIGITNEEYRKIYGIDGVDTMDKRIQFMGRVSHKESIKYVLSCDCYVFIREKTLQNQAGFPTKFTEAYTCGVPIIASDVSDIVDYSNESRVTIINSTTCEKIREAMLMSIELCGKFSHPKRIINTFDYHQYLRKTEKWISRIR